MDWWPLWRVKINVSFSRKLNYPNRIIINNIDIPLSNDAKYLVAILDHKLTWNKHICSIRGKVAGASIALKHLVNSKTLAIHNKHLFYNSCILSIITYPCPVGGFSCQTSMDNFGRLHNKNFRKVHYASRYLRNSAIRRSLDHHLKKRHNWPLLKILWKNLWSAQRNCCVVNWLWRLRTRAPSVAKILHDYGSPDKLSSPHVHYFSLFFFVLLLHKI